jgi:hypothetical protein
MRVSALVLCAVATLALFLLLVRHNEAAAARGWEETLGPASGAVYDQVRGYVEAHTLMVEVPYRRAREEEAAGAREEALHLLWLGGRSLEISTPPLLRVIRGVLSLTRRAAALGPVPALSRPSFRTREIRGLAALHASIHRVLVTMRQRMVLRLAMISVGSRWTCRLLESSTAAALDDPDAARWERMEALSADLGALAREALASLRLVLASLRRGVLAASAPQPSRAR